ncbi:hypothetical protein [Bacillus massiliigorillae]|uniref:hypothetical protein n=1 Tax=Bacillus massiliigorillae TaxID=1243664 RepID=UPI0003A0F6B7|nr:hypothetical protein [Bacillus massiliigorillae]
MTISYLEFIDRKRQQERKALEERLREEEVQLKAEYEAYQEAEQKRIREANERTFGKNRNVEALRVVGGTPVLLKTNDFSEVTNIEMVRSLDQLTHQQRNELYSLERSVFGRLQTGMTNFEVDEKLLSKAFTMRLEEFDGLVGAFELGRKRGYTDNEITQAIETSPSMEDVYKNFRKN